MINIENAVFSIVANRYDAAYPNGSRYSEPVETPAKFPCMTLWESDNSTYEGSLDTENKENHATITYDVNVYSNKDTVAKQECKQIMELIDLEMQTLGFTRLFCNQTKNQDTRVYRMTARYRGVIGKDNIIYRR